MYSCSTVIALIRLSAVVLAAILAAMPTLYAAPTVAWTVAATGGLADQTALSRGRQMMALDAYGNVLHCRHEA